MNDLSWLALMPPLKTRSNVRIPFSGWLLEKLRYVTVNLRSRNYRRGYTKPPILWHGKYVVLNSPKVSLRVFLSELLAFYLKIKFSKSGLHDWRSTSFEIDKVEAGMLFLNDWKVINYANHRYKFARIIHQDYLLLFIIPMVLFWYNTNGFRNFPFELAQKDKLNDKEM